MSDIHKRIYEILMENAKRKEPSISTMNKNGAGDVYYSADPTYPEVENPLTPKSERKRNSKKQKGGCCCGSCPIANIPDEKISKMMEFQDDGEMSNNKEAQELTPLLAENMKNPYVEQEELGQDQLASAEGNGSVGGKYCMGYGKNSDGCGGKGKKHVAKKGNKGGRKPDVNKMRQGLDEYRAKYNALRERGLTAKQAREYIKQQKAKGGNFWDTLGKIAKTALPFVPLLL